MDCSVEVRPLLQLCKVQALLWDLSGGLVATEYTSSRIKIVVNTKDYGGSCVQTELIFPEHIVFDVGTMTTPLETRVLRDRKECVQLISCREVTFNVRFHKSAGLNSEQRIESFVEPAVVAGTLYCFQCVECATGILGGGVKFRRVLPLPSDDWKEAVGEWFCHKHETASSDDLPDVLSPKPDELFTSAARLLVHDKKVREGDFDKVDGRLRCGICHIVVGRKATPSSTALFSTRVTVTPVDEEDGIPIGGVDASRLLRGLIKERLQLSITCRIVLASDKQVLLLWLMETGLQHFYSREVQCKEVRVDLQVGSKLLYLETDASDDVVTSWKEDPLVGECQLEPEVMEDTVHYLRTCCRSMGPTFERFHVIFLPGVVAQP
ncbi:E3 ubiquitin-protein ligase E3D-like [Dermacentor albipictus]|uniref:E3 ubiquitin-protein ligase E3D-like n=1 Tax=Dermacentor albipictus TaxID=60249 RepID=UPI0038FC7BFE